jgi:phage gp36-like protein
MARWIRRVCCDGALDQACLRVASASIRLTYEGDLRSLEAISA